MSDMSVLPSINRVNEFNSFDAMNSIASTSGTKPPAMRQNITAVKSSVVNPQYYVYQKNSMQLGMP